VIRPILVHAHVVYRGAVHELEHRVDHAEAAPQYGYQRHPLAYFRPRRVDVSPGIRRRGHGDGNVAGREGGRGLVSEVEGDLPQYRAEVVGRRARGTQDGDLLRQDGMFRHADVGAVGRGEVRLDLGGGGSRGGGGGLVVVVFGLLLVLHDGCGRYILL
jgi:hypothetical protein